MRSELSFDNNQIDQFRKINHLFDRRNAIVFKNWFFKSHYVSRVAETALTIKTNNLSDQIGNHGKLKQKTFRFYLQIKSICALKQVSKLEKDFAPLFKKRRIKYATHQGHQPFRGKEWVLKIKTINNNKNLVKWKEQFWQ